MGLLVLIFLALNLPLLAGQVGEHWDGAQFFAPFYHYVASLARSGHLLRWNPFCNGGSPDFAEPQIGASSPVTLLFGLLAGPGGFHLYWLGMWLFGGLGMYVFARALGAPPWGALVSALGYVMSGVYLGHGEHLSVVYTLSFVPWTLWRVRAAMRTGCWQPACEAGALWGLSALAGNPAIHFPEALFIGATAPAFLPALPADRAGRWRAVRTYVITMGLLALVGIVVLLPAYGAFCYEVVGYSHRTLPVARETVLSQGCGFGWLTALLMPAFVTQAEALPSWAGCDIAMRQMYCGAPLLVLAGFAVARRGAWREWLLLAVGLLFLGLAMGSTLPLRGWLYDLVPPMRFIRYPATFRAFFVVSAAVLAALGAARVEAARHAPDADRRLRLLAGVAGGGALLAVASYFWISLELTDTLLARVPTSAPWHLGVAWLGTLLVCLTAVRQESFRRWLPLALSAVATVDLAVAFHYTQAITFELSPTARAPQIAGPVDDLGESGWNRLPKSFDNANLYVHRPSFSNYTAMRNLVQEDWGFRPGPSQLVSGPERVYFATAAPVVPPTFEMYKAFLARARALGTLPLIRHERAALLAPPPADPTPSPEALAALADAPPARLVPTALLSYHANDLALRVTCPADGFVLVTERWARSWQATVNGRAVALEGGDFLFRLVPVRAGDNVIAMHYEVGWMNGLVALSWGTMLVVGVASLFQRLRAKPAAPVARLNLEPVPREPAVV